MISLFHLKHAGMLLTLNAASRWFPSDQVQAPQAAWLDIILYSREQLMAERTALPRSGPVADLPDAPWGIISIKVRGMPSGERLALAKH